jgi:Holliday junction resolvase RusA-like endonuclease
VKLQELKLTILGEPFAKQSFRTGRLIKGRDGRVFVPKYQPKAVLENSKSLKVQIISQLPQGFIPFNKMVLIKEIHLCFPPLKSFTKKRLKSLEIWDGEPYDYKTTKPDIDNCLKNLWDSMNGIVFIDDSLICSLSGCLKRYSLKPCIYIHLTGE